MEYKLVCSTCNNPEDELYYYNGLCFSDTAAILNIYLFCKDCVIDRYGSSELVVCEDCNERHVFKGSFMLVCCNCIEDEKYNSFVLNKHIKFWEYLKPSK